MPAGPVSEQAAASLKPTNARLLPMRAGFYALRLASDRIPGGTAESRGLPAVLVCTAPGAPELDIVDLCGRNATWLSGPHRRLFATAPPGGTVAMLTGYCAGDEGEPLDVEIRRIDRRRPEFDLPPAKNRIDLVLGLTSPSATIAIEAVALLRGEGRLRFIDTDWIGRLGTGCWVESFSLLPAGGLPPIEYKALTADGQETAWIGPGGLCGAPAASVPVIGVAVRQRPGSGPPWFVCEYGAAFQSGAVTGPFRNGAPCLSPSVNDPLEGFRLRLIPRPVRNARQSDRIIRSHVDPVPALS